MIASRPGNGYMFREHHREAEIDSVFLEFYGDWLPSIVINISRRC